MQSVFDERCVPTMSLIAVPEAAERLGVTRARVQQRIKGGSLPAQKIGRDWVINEADLRMVVRQRSGRPLSPASTRDLMAVAAGQSDQLSPWAKSRARARLADLCREAPRQHDLDDFAALMGHMLGARARRALYRASPLDLPALRDDSRLHLSGASAPAANMSAADLVEAYVDAGDLEDLERDHLLSPAKHDRANVVLHVIVGGSGQELHLASDLVIAADLAEHPGPRERGRAQELLIELAQHVR